MLPGCIKEWTQTSWVATQPRACPSSILRTTALLTNLNPLLTFIDISPLKSFVDHRQEFVPLGSSIVLLQTLNTVNTVYIQKWDNLCEIEKFVEMHNTVKLAWENELWVDL